MHKDFHLYGTYLAARTAGMNINTAQKIAYAAQAVDDFTYSDYATCQSPGQMIKTDLEVLKCFWADFHFLPGDIDTQGLDPERKYITKPSGCLFDFISETVKDCVTALSNVNVTADFSEDDYCAIIGVAMHIIADTYAHQGFSGMPSKLNLVKNLKMCGKEGLHFDLLNLSESYVPKWFTKIYPKGSIGHGTAGNAPDISWINFEYVSGDGRQVQRDNIEIFSDAFVKIYELLGDNTGDPASIKQTITSFLQWYRNDQLKTNDKKAYYECNDVTFENLLKLNSFRLAGVNCQQEFDNLNTGYEAYIKDINKLATAYNICIDCKNKDTVCVKTVMFKKLSENSLFFATYHIRELIAKKLDPDLKDI